MSAACWYSFKSSMLCGYTNANLMRRIRKGKEKTACGSLSEHNGAITAGNEHRNVLIY